MSESAGWVYHWFLKCTCREKWRIQGKYYYVFKYISSLWSGTSVRYWQDSPSVSINKKYRQLIRKNHICFQEIFPVFCESPGESILRADEKSSDSLHIVKTLSWPYLTSTCVKTRFCLFVFWNGCGRTALPEGMFCLINCDQELVSEAQYIWPGEGETTHRGRYTYTHAASFTSFIKSVCMRPQLFSFGHLRGK